MDMKKFVQERDEALLSLDKDKINAYCIKYSLTMPKDDTVMYAGIHKAILHIRSSTPEQKERSRQWLIERGYKPYLD